MSEQSRIEPQEYHPAHKQRNRMVPRLLISSLAVLLMGGVAIGLVQYTKEKPINFDSPDAPAKTRIILPEEEVPKSPDITVKKTPSVESPTPGLASTTPDPASPASTPSVPDISPVKTSLATIEKFLAASTLEERLPLIATNHPASDLESTVLSKPFPPNPQMALDFQETSPADGSTDFYYNVDFRDETNKRLPQLILVRVTKDGDAKIIANPFLDTYGGRIAAFAATPTAETGHFQAVISAVAQTTSDKNVPNHENKLRLKLLPRENEKEITSAYFSKQSNIGQMLVTEGSGFRYGQARTAKITLRWNKEEDPSSPFLEVVEIKEFRWSP